MISDKDDSPSTRASNISRPFIPQPRVNCDNITNPMGKKLISLCRAHDLLILNGRTVGDTQGKYTFYDNAQGASTIDLAIASNPLLNRIKSFLVNRPNELSKHCKITLRISNMKSNIQPKPKENYPWIELEGGFVWSDMDLSEEKFKDALSSESVKKLLEECTQYLDAGLIESSSKKIQEVFTEAAKTSLEPKKRKINSKSHPFKHKIKRKKWFDQECSNQRDLTRKLAIYKHNNPDNKAIRTEHNTSLKNYKKLCKLKKAQFDEEQRNHLKERTLDPTGFWRHWKFMGDTYPDSEPPGEIDGKKWENYFMKLYEPHPPKNEDRTTPGGIDHNYCTNPINKPFTKKELDDVIAKLKCNKAAGKDRILAEFLKASPSSIRKLLLRLFNTIYKTSIIPILFSFTNPVLT